MIAGSDSFGAMLDRSAERIAEQLGPGAVVLDVGGWAKPFPRADWVLDLMPYETRGLYGERSDEPERFDTERWVQRDICDHEPWPFPDQSIDFAICSHTLEDVRDPVWVCAELNRVARAGYLEVPSRVEEQSWGVHGPWVGWSHHHWLVDKVDGGLEFVLKPHLLHGSDGLALPVELGAELTLEERVTHLFWEGGFRCQERIFYEPGELERYLRGLVVEWKPRLEPRVPPARAARLLRRIRGRAS
jgi:hypothetical protein